MIEQAEGKPVQPGRLHPAFLQIELDQGDALQQLPGNGGGQHGPDLRLVLPDDKPHFRRKLPPSGAAHALQKGGHRPGGVDLKGPFQTADVDAQLQRGGGHGGHILGIVLHDLLRRFPVGGGEVAVVDQEPVRLVHAFAVLPQGGGNGLAFLPGVDEDQAFLPPGMLKNVTDAGIRVFRGLVGFLFQHRQGLDVGPVLGGLGVFDIEMLHAQPPAAPLGLDLRDDGPASGAQGQKFPGLFRIADGGGQPDAAGVDPGQPGQPLDEAQGLPAPVTPEQGVDFVDDHKPQIAEELGDGGVLVQQHGLQGFRCDLQDPAGMLHELALVTLSYVAMPVPDRNVGLGAQVVETGKLVVDQRLQGADIDTAHAPGHILGKQGDDGEKGGLRLAGSGGGGQQHIVIGVENRFPGGHLNRPEVFPAVAVDILLHKGGITVKYVHRFPLTIQIPRRKRPPLPPAPRSGRR